MASPEHMRKPGGRLTEREHRPVEWVLAASLAALGVMLAVAVPQRGGFGFDEGLIQWAQRADGLEGAAWFFNDLLNNWIIPALWLGSVALYLAAGRRDVAAFFGMAYLLAPATAAMKLLVGRERPAGSFDVLEFPDSYSFPSGHMTTAIGLFGSWFMLAPYLLPASWILPVRALCLAAIGLTAFFRVWVGAHWPSDVTGSMLFGSGALIGMSLLFAVLGQRRRDTGRPPAPAARELSREAEARQR